MSKKPKDLQESLNFIIDNMVIKDDMENVATKEDLSATEKRLDAKIDYIGSKLGAFETTEVDKRKMLEVRVAKLEHKVLS